MPSKFSDIDFDLRQLEIFKQVVDLQSFSRAADAVSLAQASVSERVANLESAVGTRLLDRLGRKIVPTRTGELLYKHALLLLELKENAVLELQEFLGIKGGEVRIGGSTIPGEYILPRLLGEFHAEFPEVSVILSISDSKAIEKQVLNGEVELGIIGSESSERNLRTNKLWKDELVLAVPQNHKWAPKKSISIEELKEEPFITRESGSGTLKIMNDYLQAAGLQGIKSLKIIAGLGTSSAVKEAVKSGLGVSILSLKALETEIQSNIIVPVKIKGLHMSRHFYLIKDKRRMSSPLCQAMSDFLTSSAV